MEISIADAQARLAELVRHVAEGEDVVLTEQGRRVARLVAEPGEVDLDGRADRLAEISARAARKALPGPSAARSQDFLYDENGMPG